VDRSAGRRAHRGWIILASSTGVDHLRQPARVDAGCAWGDGVFSLSDDRLGSSCGATCWAFFHAEEVTAQSYFPKPEYENENTLSGFRLYIDRKPLSEP
jgi:hypothetical protein